MEMYLFIFIAIFISVALVAYVFTILLYRYEKKDKRHWYYVVWIDETFQYCSPEMRTEIYHCTAEEMYAKIKYSDFPPKSITKLD